MKYLCLVYLDEPAWDAMPRSDYDALTGEILDYRDELRQSDHFVASEALQRSHTATMIRVPNGKVSITDGPYAETKEQIGGFYLIDAEDLNEAIRLAAKIPSARRASIEVRPIKELTPRAVDGSGDGRSAHPPDR
jgi:hypothetical protein